MDPDARWSDGRPVTVDDLFFSLYFLLSPHLNDPAINRVYDQNITRITRFDGLTFALTASKANPDQLFGLSTFIFVQREFYREFGPDYVDRYHWRFSPVTGAYSLDPATVRKGRQITFNRIDDWWADKKPFYQHRFNVDKLTFNVIRDDTKAFESFLNGEIDWHTLLRPELWYDRSQESPISEGYIERAWVYDQLPAPREGVYINSMQPLLDNRTIRIGIHHAINYDRVNEGLYRNDRRRIRAFAEGFGPYTHPTLQPRPFSIAQALGEFAEAGFTTRGNDGILINEAGQRLSFELTVENAGDEVSIASVLKEEAQKAGLELRINTMDRTAFFTKIFEKNYELAVHGWTTGSAPFPSFEWELRSVDAGEPQNFNTTNIRSEALDRLLAEWDQLADPVRAHAVSHAVQQEVHDFAAWVPGLTADYSRWGYWRWVRWPDYFQVPRYFFFMSTGVFWIDDELGKETRDAMETGKTFPAVTRIYDCWRGDAAMIEPLGNRL
ncbi:MAG: ABC transporter substrate-binding protein [Pseudomonadota bacterium]